MKTKVLRCKNYGSIPHLPDSRLGPGDHFCNKGQAHIACVSRRNKHDKVIAQEKLDGSNVGVALVDDRIYALSRSGYLANTSPHIVHHLFAAWVDKNEERFRAVLSDRQRICGEWLSVAHGTKYVLKHEPFVAFDIMDNKNKRMSYDDFVTKSNMGEFIKPKVLSYGPPISIDAVESILGKNGHHGAIEEAEGAVWRVERNVLNDKKIGNRGGRHWEVNFLVKYVRSNKVDGKYLGDTIIYNECI